jgi:hypothetical protein
MIRDSDDVVIVDNNDSSEWDKKYGSH